MMKITIMIDHAGGWVMALVVIRRSGRTSWVQLLNVMKMINRRRIRGKDGDDSLEKKEDR